MAEVLVPVVGDLPPCPGNSFRDPPQNLQGGARIVSHRAEAREIVRDLAVWQPVEAVLSGTTGWKVFARHSARAVPGGVGGIPGGGT